MDVKLPPTTIRSTNPQCTHATLEMYKPREKKITEEKINRSFCSIGMIYQGTTREDTSRFTWRELEPN